MLEEETKQKLDSTITAFQKDHSKLFERTVWVKSYCPCFTEPWFSKIGQMLNFQGRYGSITENTVHSVQMDNMVH